MVRKCWGRFSRKSDVRVSSCKQEEQKGMKDDSLKKSSLFQIFNATNENDFAIVVCYVETHIEKEEKGWSDRIGTQQK